MLPSKIGSVMPQITCLACHAELPEAATECSSCKTVVTPLMRVAANGPIDGRFELVALLGRGGMGEAYRVRHVTLSLTRVLKVMRADLLSDELRQRFIREARIASELRHPRLASLLDLITLPDGQLATVWEFVHGVPLNKHLAKGRLGSPDVISIGLQVLDGLAHMHEKKVLHRDISPQNIVVQPDNDGVVLIDFGIAKDLSGAQPDITRMDQALGNIKYAAPEQTGALPSAEPIDGRADTYALACVLYEALSGVPPFTGNNDFELARAHALDTPASIIAKLGPGSGVPPALEETILRAMAKHPAQRFPSAHAFAQALQDATTAPGTLVSQAQTIPFPRQHDVITVPVITEYDLGRQAATDNIRDGKLILLTTPSQEAWASSYKGVLQEMYNISVQTISVFPKYLEGYDSVFDAAVRQRFGDDYMRVATERLRESLKANEAKLAGAAEQLGKNTWRFFRVHNRASAPVTFYVLNENGSWQEVNLEPARVAAFWRRDTDAVVRFRDCKGEEKQYAAQSLLAIDGAGAVEEEALVNVFAEGDAGEIDFYCEL